ncbi:MAG: MATE family efflux transporter [Muribaculaceae bacterium]
MQSSSERLKELSESPVGRLLWKYSLPAVVGMVVMSLYNVIDRIYIGRGVGADAISGLAITFPVMNLSAALGVLIGAGASTRVSILLGAGNIRGASRVLGNALVLTVAIGIGYISLFGIFLKDILTAFGAGPNTLPYAYDFMLYLLPGMLMINLTFSFNNIMRASGYPLRAMFTMIIGAALNVALAPVFIFYFDMGIKGAAIASDISMTVSMIFVMSHFCRKDVTVRFQRGIYRLSASIVWSIVAIGAAPALVNAASCLINILINKSLVSYGSDLAVGAAGIFVTYTSLLTTFVLGICMGMQPIVGYNYGAGRLHRLKRAYYLAAGVGTCICTAGCIFGLFFPGLIAKTFTVDATLISVTVNALTLALPMFWMVGFQIVSTTFFQSIDKAGKSIVLSLVRQVIFLIPLLLTLPRTFGLDGVWLSFPSSDLIATVVTALLIIIQMRSLSAGGKGSPASTDTHSQPQQQ